MVYVAREMERRGMKLPLMIGGATTSKLHTAVKIAQNYSGPVVHVLDASKSVVVMSSLIDPETVDDFMADVDEEYEELRDDHYESLSSRKYLTYEEALKQAPALEWNTLPAPVKPKKLGLTVLKTYDLASVVPYIDWVPFFQLWQLRGTYPTRSYPKIFDDPNVGKQAKQVFDEAQVMLKGILEKKTLKASAVVGIWPANVVGQDIEVYAVEDDDNRENAQPVAKFFGLRQQAQKVTQHPYFSIADFIAPKDTGIKDYVGGFACTAGFGVDELSKAFLDDHDDYNSIMVKGLADRLAEALAEKLHADMRRDIWGYAADEDLSPADCLNCKYQGIRPAPGYPTQPDHVEKKALWKLLSAKEHSGIELTETLAMMPAASVSALVFANPHSEYFSLGKVQQDQVKDYAERRGQTLEETERCLGANLAYK
eukprot:Plantae.Rhodophyta-Palmaria_palmata.ctg9284.p1 GENE.Plantae.Rhodophyta-Palmaria_palmata.ctg9284~~Plantae.Rhodophyta-Palmaria_palmata.ctg9284.p1  ORF type:complete len:463 (-),score=109.70 Plantae.Rhodophyta-Palmaria_palmata.ctg9284:49-1326(-)